MRRAHVGLIALFLLVHAAGAVWPLTAAGETAVCGLALLLLAGVLFALLRRLFRDGDKAALAATLLLAVLGLAGEFHRLLRHAFPLLIRPLASGLPLAWSGVAGIGVTLAAGVVLARTRRDLKTVNQAVLAATAALLVAAVGSRWADPRGAQVGAATVPPGAPLRLPAGRPPDIYYLVLDSYTSLDALRDAFGEPMAEFRAFLEARGFLVEPAARTAYRRTLLCLASRLNMDYPPASLTDWNDRINRNALARLVRDSAAPARLREAGYRIVNLSMLPLGPEPARYPLELALCFPSVRERLLAHSVLAFRIPGFMGRRRKAGPEALARSLLQPFEDLEAVAVAPSDRPRLIVAHLMITHPPFVFDRAGGVHGFALPARLAENRHYTEQLHFATGRLMKTLETILAQGSPPVVILQGDHGYRGMRAPSPARTRQAASVLYAIRMPGLDVGRFRAHAQPVNTFRLVLNTLFDAGLPLLDWPESASPDGGTD